MLFLNSWFDILLIFTFPIVMLPISNGWNPIINLINVLNIQFDISKNLVPYNLSSELNDQKEFAINLYKYERKLCNLIEYPLF